MSFLSSADRERAIAQHRQLDALLQYDQQALIRRLHELTTLRSCVHMTVSRIQSADEGTSDIDEIAAIDSLAGDLLRQGIRYCPVVVSTGDAKVVRA